MIPLKDELGDIALGIPLSAEGYLTHNDPAAQARDYSNLTGEEADAPVASEAKDMRPDSPAPSEAGIPKIVYWIIAILVLYFVVGFAMSMWKKS